MIYVRTLKAWADSYDHWQCKVRLSLRENGGNCMSMTLFRGQGETRFYKASYSSVFDAATIDDVAVLHESLQGRMSVTKGVLKMLTDASDKIEKELGETE